MSKHHNTKIKKISKKKSESNVVRITLITILVVSLGIMIGIISYTVYSVNNYHDKIITYNVLNTSVEVVSYNIMGLNTDKDAVKFGKITAGNSGTRFLNISTKEKAVVSIYVSGEMADYISVERNNFVIEQSSSQLVPITLQIPKETPPGKYTGEIDVKLSRP